MVNPPVVKEPLWKIWYSQLGWLFPRYGNTKNKSQPLSLSPPLSLSLPVFWQTTLEVINIAVDNGNPIVGLVPMNEYELWWTMSWMNVMNDERTGFFWKPEHTHSCVVRCLATPHWNILKPMDRITESRNKEQNLVIRANCNYTNSKAWKSC